MLFAAQKILPEKHLMNSILPSITSENLIRFGIAFIPAVIGIVLHEVAHGWVAYRQGDPTAKMLGRLTLNPIKHVDLTGLLVFIFTALFSPFIIGWAKPVPVNARYFSNPRKGMMLVSLAGPLTNFLLAIIFAVVSRIMIEVVSPYGQISAFTYYAFSSVQFGIAINCMLAVFNLLPIPPLDGSHILAGLLPKQLAIYYEQLSKYGFIILILLLMSGLLSKVLYPLIQTCTTFIKALAGL